MDSNEIDRRVRRQVGWLVYYITMPNNFGQHSVLSPGSRADKQRGDTYLRLPNPIRERENRKSAGETTLNAERRLDSTASRLLPHWQRKVESVSNR